MKQVKIILTGILVIFLITNFAQAGDFKAEQPFLITPCGQSPDALMIKIISQKSGLKFTYDKLAYPDTLKGNKTLIFVSGGSTKGLGAANIDKEQEQNRVESLIKTAQKEKMSIINMHVGGKSRRGKLSDFFNSLAAENADCLIILKSGDEDKFFTKIAEKKKIPIYFIDKIMEAGGVLKNIFGVKK